MFGLSFEELREVQGYAFFFFITFLTTVLYGYIVHLYKNDKNGTTNYEQYGKIALDDEITSTPIEEHRSNINKK
jgi:cytochrome c oxidase cbb3-type subunit 4